MKNAFVTGVAGFIGSNLLDRLLIDGWSVTGFDNFDPFYSSELKRRNLASHHANTRFRLVEGDIRDLEALRRASGNFDVIVHLAAKAGVRPSIEDPFVYQEVNVGGTQNVLEVAREWGVRQVVFASSSSVYGVNPNVPWREDDQVLQPISPYASTKVSGELLGHVYRHLYGIRFIALRFFTVYGPRQRPDLAIHKFANLLLDGIPIPLYGDGNTHRDYTYIGDIVDGVRSAMEYTNSLYEVFNLGSSRPLTLLEMIDALQEVFGLPALKDSQPLQLGDVPQTYADISKAKALLGFEPRTEIREGLRQFAVWLLKSVVPSAGHAAMGAPAYD